MSTSAGITAKFCIASRRFCRWKATVNDPYDVPRKTRSLTKLSGNLRAEGDMFTGLIEELGTIRRRIWQTHKALTIAASGVDSRTGSLGDRFPSTESALTALRYPPIQLSTPSSAQETIAIDFPRATCFPVTPVNLEVAPLKAGARLADHIVQGHVDGTAKLVRLSEPVEWKRQRKMGSGDRTFPLGFEKYVVSRRLDHHRWYLAHSGADRGRIVTGRKSFRIL